MVEKFNTYSMEWEDIREGGPESGNHGHSGRPGERGGSSSEGGVSMEERAHRLAKGSVPDAIDDKIRAIVWKDKEVIRLSKIADDEDARLSIGHPPGVLGGRDKNIFRSDAVNKFTEIYNRVGNKWVKTGRV
jgi:hypothetical protein